MAEPEKRKNTSNTIAEYLTTNGVAFLPFTDFGSINAIPKRLSLELVGGGIVGIFLVSNLWIQVPEGCKCLTTFGEDAVAARQWLVILPSMYKIVNFWRSDRV